MDKRRLISLVVVLGVLLFAWNQVFVEPNNIKKDVKMQQNPETHNFEKVLPYENAYMSNTTNMGGLFGALPLNEYIESFKMDSETFSFMVNYNATAAELGETVGKSVVYNMTAAFTLIGNIEKVEMYFLDESFIVTRENVEKWYRTTLVDLKDPVTFKERVQSKLDDNIDQWIAAYTKEE